MGERAPGGEMDSQGVLRLIGLAVLLAVGLLYAVVALFPGWPLAAGLLTWGIVAQLMAFPLLVGSFTLLLTLAGVSLLKFRRAKTSAKAALSPVIRWGLAGLFILPSLVLILFPTATPWSGHATAPKNLTGAITKLNVVNWNTYGKLSTDRLGEIIERFDPDIMVLPETGGAQLTDLLKHLGDRGVAFQSFTAESTSFTIHHTDIQSVSVLIHERLGKYEEAPAGQITFGVIKLVSAEKPNMPAVIGLHAAPPLPSLMSSWSEDLRAVADICEGHRNSNLILAGDFNATLRHGPMAQLANCGDVFASLGHAYAGTWPSSMRSVIELGQ